MSEGGNEFQVMIVKLSRSLEEVQDFLSRRDYKSARLAVSPVIGELLDENTQSSMDEAAVSLLGSALHMLGICEYEIGDPDEAKKIFEQGLGLATSLQDDTLMALHLHELSLVAYKQGRLGEALQFCEQSIEKTIDRAFVKIGQGLTPGYIDFDLNQLGGSLNQLAVLYQEAGDFDKAFEILTVLKAHCERVYNFDLLGVVLNELGMTCFAAGRHSEGVRFFFDSIKTKARHGHNSTGISKSVLNLQACLARYPAALQQEDVSRILKEYRP
jgi:tetratricopeptide (TPR) repeat protein